jgi:hypothetical protein
MRPPPPLPPPHCRRRPRSAAAHRFAAPPAVGHVLGIGTLWEDKGCTSGCVVGSGTPNYYKCKHARAAYANTTGCSGDLPIETKAPAGSSCGHCESRRGGGGGRAGGGPAASGAWWCGGGAAGARAAAPRPQGRGGGGGRCSRRRATRLGAGACAGAGSSRLGRKRCCSRLLRRAGSEDVLQAEMMTPVGGRAQRRRAAAPRAPMHVARPWARTVSLSLCDGCAPHPSCPPC